MDSMSYRRYAQSFEGLRTNHRWSHNLKVAGLNPVPATKISPLVQRLSGLFVARLIRKLITAEPLWKQEGAKFCANCSNLPTSKVDWGPIPTRIR